MNDCIYCRHCTRTQCDIACPTYIETQFWLERCNIQLNNPVFKMSDEDILDSVRIVNNGLGRITHIASNNTNYKADCLAYVSICLHGRGTALNHGIYHLNFSEYLDELKHSWQTRYESEKLQFMKIWSDSCNYLIISHLDFIKFGDFESQLLLQLMNSRKVPNKATFIVTPGIHKLVYNKDSVFFTRFVEELKEAKDE